MASQRVDLLWPFRSNRLAIPIAELVVVAANESRNDDFFGGHPCINSTTVWFRFPHTTQSAMCLRHPPPPS